MTSVTDAGLSFVAASPFRSTAVGHLRGSSNPASDGISSISAVHPAEPSAEASSGLAASVAMLSAGVAIAALNRRAARRGRDASRIIRQAVGAVSLNSGGIMGSSLDINIKTEAKTEEEMLKVNLPVKGIQDGKGIIRQFRCVYPAGLERYGEEYARMEGSTDNVYMLTGMDSDKSAAAMTRQMDLTGQGYEPWVLLGLHEGAFASKFLDVLGDEVDRLGHIVIMYFDGKQGQTLEAIVKARSADLPPLQVHCSNPVKVALTKGLAQESLDKIVIQRVLNGATVKVSDERTLRFVLTPTPKLPEAMSCFDPASGYLFTGKFFSAHRCVGKPKAPFDMKGIKGWEEFSYDWYHLFDSYFFTERAQRAVRRIFGMCDSLDGPDVECLAPMHGPVVRDQCWKLMAKYEAWTAAKMRKEDRRDTEVLVMYASAYGHTKTLAGSVEKGLKSSGVRVTSINLEHTPVKEVVKALERCNGFCMGSPTLGGEMPSQVKEALGAVIHSGGSATVKKPCGVFGSYGWSGEAVDELQFRLKDGGFPFAFDPIKVKFRPTTEATDLCEEAGVRMAQKVQFMIREAKKKRVRKIEQVASGVFVQAFDKIKTSQCVFSAKDKSGADVLIPLSWVNQAGFDPPQVSISVSKDLLDVVFGIKDFSAEEIKAEVSSKYETETGALSPEQLRSLLETVGLADQTEEAIRVLDEDQDGEISIDEVVAAMTNKDGPLYERFLEHLRALTFEKQLQAEDGKNGLRFNLTVLEKTADVSQISQFAAHKKAKPANGCKVVAEAHAFLECVALNAMNAGENVMILAKVDGGKVLSDGSLTQLVSVGEMSRLFGSGALKALKVEAPKVKAKAKPKAKAEAKAVPADADAPAAETATADAPAAEAPVAEGAAT